MKLSSNFIRFHDEFGLKKTIDIFSDAGFEAIEFNTDLNEYYNDTHNGKFYKDIKAYANDKGIVFGQAHAPFASSFPDEAKTKQRFGEIIKSMEHSALLGAEMIVVHPCKNLDYKEAANYAPMFEFNIGFYKKLIPYAEAFGIKIAIENIKGAITETPKGLLDVINALDNEVFTVCYDVGHANICGEGAADMIRALGKHIGCTHIHDNDGTNDSYTLPYYGTIDWESVMKAFAEVGYEGNLNYEAGFFVDKVPVALRAESAKYMAKTGKYLIERFMSYK